MNTAVAQRAAALTWSVVVEVATGLWWAVKLMVALILLQVAVAGVAFSSVALFSPDEVILLFVKKEVSTDTHDKAFAKGSGHAVVPQRLAATRPRSNTIASKVFFGRACFLMALIYAC